MIELPPPHPGNPDLKRFISEEPFASWGSTLPETNIFAPENGWLEDYVPFGMAYFQGYVSFREGRPKISFVLVSPSCSNYVLDVAPVFSMPVTTRINYEPFLGSGIPTVQPSFPTIASCEGGHTQIIQLQNLNNHQSMVVSGSPKRW